MRFEMVGLILNKSSDIVYSFMKVKVVKIATVAAGSRQQSRFIAMMSDYERTMELVSAANNSAGSSQEQFDKTLESLQSKLNKLSDAWQLFTMGIMNSEFIKDGVDLLTGILTAVNDLTGSFGDLGTLISRVGLIIGSLWVGKKVFTRLSSSVTELFEGVSKHFKEQTIKSKISGEEAGRAYGQGIAQGIVNERQNIQNAIDYAMGNTNSMPALIRPVVQAQTSTPKNNVQTTTAPSQNDNVFKKGIDTVNQKFESKSFEEMTISMSKAALASEGVALGLSVISSALENNGADEAAKGFQNFATAASGLGIVLQTLPVILKTIGVTSSAALGWVGLVITGVTLLGTAVYTAIDAIETEEEKLERLTTEAEESAAAYDDILKKSEELTSNHQAYEDMQNDFENLTKGTKEWKDALAETNQQVLELISTYPELVNYMSRSSDGKLSIDMKGWTELEKAQEKAERYGYIAKSVDQIELAEQRLKLSRRASIQMSEEESRVVAFGSQMGSIGISEKYSRINNAMMDAQNGRFDDKTFDEIKETLQSQYNILEKDLNSVATSIVNYLETVRENELLVEAQYVSMLNGALEHSDNSTSRFADSTISLLSQKEKDEAAILDELFGEGGKYKDYSLEGLQEVLKIYELSMEQVGEEVWNNETKLKNKIANLEFGEQLIRDLEKVLAVSEEWSTNDEKIGPTNISKSDFIDAYNNFNIGQANVEDYAILKEILALPKETLNSIEGIDTILIEDAKIVEEKVEKQRQDEVTQKERTFSKARMGSGFSSVILDRSYGKEQMKKLSSDQYESYLGMLRNVLANSENNKDEIGETIANFFEESIIGVVDDMDLSSIMDNLSSFDFNTEQGLLDFENYLRDLGYAVPADQIDGLIEKLKELGGAANNISFDQAIEKGKVLRDARETLESDGDLTEEQMEALIETGKFERDNFIRTLDGYKLTGMDIETAIYTIGEEIVNALTQGAENDQKKEDLGENFRNRVENSDLSDPEKNRLLTGTATEAEILAFYGGSSNIPSQARDSIIAQYERESGAVGFKADPNAGLTGAFTAFQLETQNLTPNELLNFDLTSFKEQYDIIGRAADLINKDYADALISAANESDDFKNSLKSQLKILEKNPDAFDYNQKEVLKTVKAYMEAQEKMEKFGATMEDNIEILRQGPDAKGYLTAITDVTEAMKGIFGSVVDESFVEENLSLIFDFYNGVEGAQQELIEKLDGNWATAFNVPIENITNARDAIFDVVAEIEEDGHFTIEGQADLINIIENFLGVQDVMNMTAEEAARVNEFLASMGANIQMKPFTSETTWASLSELSALQSKGWMPTGETRGTPPNFATGSLSSGNIEVELVKMSGGFTYTPTGKGSYIPGSNDKGGTPGGTSGGDSTPSISEPSEMNENPYDKIYEITRKINQELRARQDLENQFNQGFEGSRYKAVSYEDEQGNIQWKFEEQENLGAMTRLELLNEQEKSLLRQVALQQDLADAERESIRNLLEKNEELNKYVSFEEDGKIKIEYDEIAKRQAELETTRNDLLKRKPAENADKTTIEKYNAEVEAYEEQKTLLEQIIDLIAEVIEHEDAALDAEDEQQNLAAQYEELQEQGKQDWIDFLDRVLDAVIYERQKEIDELSNINDSINDTNSRILDGIQDQIDLQRRQRDNQKKENEIEEKQRRLDYLRQDTSNANDLAIKQLEKEIAEQQEDYTDTLIDQKISDLQDQNDAAAEQRERQIELMQSQLDWQIENGELWEEVNRLIDEGIDKTTGEIKENSELFKKLQNAEGYKSLSGFAQSEWKIALNEQIMSGLRWLYQELDKNNDNDPFNDEQSEPGETVDFYDTKGKLKTGTFDEDGSIRLQNGDYTTEYSDFTRDMTGRYHAGAERTRFNAAEKNWARDEEGNWIINDNEGNALKDQWISYKDNEYYMDKEGKLATGWKKLDDKWYYFDPTEGATQGALKTGWLEQNGVWYYLDTEGANRGEMYTGEREIDGKIHVFAENGAWLYEKKNEGANGEEPKDPENPEDPETGEPKDNTATKEGWYEEDGKWYYGKDGKKLSGWQRLGTPWFYFDPSNGNAMVTGEHEIDGVKYYFDENGYWLEDGQQPGTGDPVVDGSTLKVKAGELFDRDPNYYVRKSKSETAAELYNTRNIPDNEEVEILEKSGNWYKISSSLGTGWFSAAELKGIKSAYHERMKAFKTGGLADFTGPAWLDGTKSRPELVLNQEDTQNFIKLKDVLSSFMDNVRVSGGSSNNSGGDNYFDIDIAVDEIASDYDVDQLAERIKKTIYEDSLYRNVNMLSFHR